MNRTPANRIMTAEEMPARPFLKWVGGKRQLLSHIRQIVPASFRGYYEPFVGGGAVFFDLRPKQATLFDINAELVNTWKVVRDNVEPLISALGKYVYEESRYYAVRAIEPLSLSPVARAARMIYLNKTGYNGLYRVNRSGTFNVPFGRHSNPTICDAANLRRAGAALQRVTVQCASFEGIASVAGKGDLVYLDPPYIPASRSSNFVSYQKRGFGMDNQERLAEVVEALDKRGALIILSNSDVPWMRKRYKNFHIHPIFAMRTVNSLASSRGPVGELIITNY